VKKFVIAGTAEQARQWIKTDTERRWRLGQTSANMSEYVVVFNPTQLRGVSDPHGVFVGTWRQRDNIFDIVQNLMLATRDLNPRLMAVWIEVQGMK
jgi:hypothetical protein